MAEVDQSGRRLDSLISNVPNTVDLEGETRSDWTAEE
jgi:hypothetical protein